MAPLSPPASDFRKKPLEDALRLLGLTFVVFPIGQILNTRRHTALENAAPRAHYARIVLVNLRICRWAITRYSSASRRDATAYGKSA
jgi:hypothetical protein